jgi:hypothetical protein
MGRERLRINRRDLLWGTTVAFLCASAGFTAHGAGRSGSADGDETLEDFENGWKGWTFTGDCWATGPTRASESRVRAANCQGACYLSTTLEGMGTAVSPQYALDRPYLKFKIAGGSSRDTRVDLLVDGKVDRWVAGNNGLRFEDVCVDLAHLQGTKLTIQVIDNSTDRDWGLILVDDFRLSDTPLNRDLMTPQDFGVQPRFVQDCQFFTNDRQRAEGRRLDVGLSPEQFDYAINEVFKRTVSPDMDHLPGSTVEEVAKRIGGGVEQVMRRLQIGDRPELLKSWLLAEAASAWVATHVGYDASIVDAPIEVKTRRALSSVTLQQEVPRAVCSGLARLTMDLGTALGLKCYHIGGEFAAVGRPRQGHDNHAWVYFHFGPGIASVADTTLAGTSLTAARDSNGKHDWVRLLPRSPLELELFLAEHYATQRLFRIDLSAPGIRYIESADYSLTDMTYRRWQDLDTGYLLPLSEKYGQVQKDRVRRLSRALDIRACRL